MKDRFKFRVYYKPHNKVYNVICLNCYRQKEIIIEYNGSTTVVEWKNCEILQSTGLHDKNGKLIYEGDILKQPDGIVDYVYWENGCYLHNGTAITNYDFCYQGDSWAKEVNTHEVIGNMYENPELIERI